MRRLRRVEESMMSSGMSPPDVVEFRRLMAFILKWVDHGTIPSLNGTKERQ
jgi:hypothetical protein